MWSKFLPRQAEPIPVFHDGAKWTAETRPDHRIRYREHMASLKAKVFGVGNPAETAYFGIVGTLCDQLALAQLVLISKYDLEIALSSRFVLGYIFGTAAWHMQRYGVPRTGPMADQLLLDAHREVYGPISGETIVTMSLEASMKPDFVDGMRAAAADLNGPEPENSDARGLFLFIMEFQSETRH